MESGTTGDEGLFLMVVTEGLAGNFTETSIAYNI